MRTQFTSSSSCLSRGPRLVGSNCSKSLDRWDKPDEDEGRGLMPAASGQKPACETASVPAHTHNPAPPDKPAAPGIRHSCIPRLPLSSSGRGRRQHHIPPRKTHRPGRRKGRVFRYIDRRDESVPELLNQDLILKSNRAAIGVPEAEDRVNENAERRRLQAFGAHRPLLERGIRLLRGEDGAAAELRRRWG